MLGSVATEVLHRARLPMLLVPGPSRQFVDEPPVAGNDIAAAEPVRLLVPLDVSDKADAVLPEVAKLARATNADVILLNVFLPIVELVRVRTDSREQGIAYVTAERRMYLEGKAEQLHGIKVTTRVEALPHGEEVEEGIARIAAETHAAMVVLVGAERSPQAEPRIVVAYRYFLPIIATATGMAGAIGLVAGWAGAVYLPAVYVFLMCIVGTQNAWDLLLDTPRHRRPDAHRGLAAPARPASRSARAPTTQSVHGAWRVRT